MRQEIAEAAGCAEGAGLRTGGAGPAGGPFQEPAEARWHDISRNFSKTDA